jgi:hypothetical protein
MSAVTNLSSVSPSALPPINLHGHGHKHGSHVESTDASEDSTSNDALGQAPAGSTQNLFGTLMQSLEQVIGLSTTTPATTTSAATPATTASATASASAATPCATASASNGASTTAQQSTLLQNYLNNLSHKPQVNGSQASTLTGSGVNASA